MAFCYSVVWSYPRASCEAEGPIEDIYLSGWRRIRCICRDVSKAPYVTQYKVRQVTSDVATRLFTSNVDFKRRLPEWGPVGHAVASGLINLREILVSFCVVLMFFLNETNSSVFLNMFF